MSSAVIMTFSKWRKIESNFLWKMSPATVALKGMIVNLNWPISVLKVDKKLDSSSSGWCQYPLEQSSTGMTVALDSWCAMSSGFWKQCGSWSMALFRLVGSKQIQSFGLSVFLFVDSTKTKLLIHGVASWTGLITLTVSIFSISCLKICFRSTGMGLQGVCLGVIDGFVWIWYGSPGKQPMPLKSSGYCSWICSFVLDDSDFLLCVFSGKYRFGSGY